MWEITRKLSEEIFLIEFIEHGSIVYSDHYNSSFLCVSMSYILVVGAKVQNSYVLGLGLTRVQIDKYWILILIREPEFPRRYE